MISSCTYDSARFGAADYVLCGVPSPEPIQRAGTKRRAEHLAGRICARHALTALTGVGTVPAMGVDRAPVWPAGVVGAITHSPTWAAAAVGMQKCWRGIGVDIEPVLPTEQALELSLQFAHARERARIQHEQQDVALTAVFSLKESFFKAIYPQVKQAFYFEHVEVVHLSLQEGTARLRLLRDLSAVWQTGVEVSAQFVVFHAPQASIISLCAV